MTNQQAINLLKGLEQSLDDYCELNDEGKAAFRMAITALELFGNSEQLPSAQPDLSEYSDKLWRNAYERGKADAKPERKTEWIPIKWHDCTDADREKYGFSDDIVAVFDCEMPDDDQAILVTTSHGYVNQDVCYIDDGFSLDSGYDWIDDITAWMPLPEPYKERREE